MRIDAYTHFFPKRFFDKLLEIAGDYKDMGKRVRALPALFDLDHRKKIVDDHVIVVGEDVLDLAVARRKFFLQERDIGLEPLRPVRRIRIVLGVAGSQVFGRGIEILPVERGVLECGHRLLV